MNLIGEHLDYNGGRCLPIAIDRSTSVRVSPSLHGQLSVTSGGLEWSGLPGERAEGWAGYVVGVLWALGVDAALDLTVGSDVPIGAGLSSSAALECATAVAVNDLLALGRSAEELAAACVRAENEYVGAPTGGLDQLTVLFARHGQALLLDFADGSRTPVPFTPEADGLALVVVDTQVAHALVDGGYADRRAACDRAAALLGVRHLANAEPSVLRTLPADLLPLARHVVGEQGRVDAFAAALARRDWAGAGTLMTASHASLRDDFAVSCAELDAVVATALATGALGARMTGAGFGGSAIALVPHDAVPAFGAAVTERFARNGWEAPTVFTVEASAGAEVLPAT